MNIQLPTNFGTYTEGFVILTLLCFVITLLAFIFKWGIRFRFVGITAFMGVLTIGLFGLNLGLFQRTTIPGAVRYTLVFDNAASNVVIAVPPQTTPTQVEATLKQVAIDITPFGRLGNDNSQVLIRARTIIHPEKGVSAPLYLGQLRKSVGGALDDSVNVEIFTEVFPQVEKVS